MNTVKDLFHGAIIGIANIIPGVSGGTLALVLGIYEKLIQSIHNISIETVKSSFKLFTFKKDAFLNFKVEMQRINGAFLLKITIGAFSAIALLAKLMTFLLKHQHDPTYGFFFGLVLVSVIAPYKMIKKKDFSVFLSALIAIVCVFSLSQLVSGDKLLEKAKTKYEMELNKSNFETSGQIENSQNNFIYYLYIFFLGSITISAMILPGVSGSFLLLLLGGYFDILKAISNTMNAIVTFNKDVLLSSGSVLLVFTFGCLFGVILFSRFLNFLLLRWHDLTMSFLVGLVLGSLWMIWPFKTTARVGPETVYLSNKIPQTFGTSELFTLLSLVAGMIIVYAMLWYESRNDKSISE
jgi:putative membrane protein